MDGRVADLEREKAILEENCQKSFKAIQGFTIKLQSKEQEVKHVFQWNKFVTPEHSTVHQKLATVDNV